MILSKLIPLIQVASIGSSIGFGIFIVYAWSKEIKNKTEVQVDDILSTVQASVGSDLSRIFLNRSRSAVNIQCDYHIFRTFPKDVNNETQVQDYFAPIFYCLEKTQKSIKVIDSVASHSGLNIKHCNDLIQGYYATYFTIIERIVENNPAIEYSRYIQLTHPLAEQYSKYGLEGISEHLYSRTLKHIKKLKQCNNFTLYILTKPLGNFSQLIIDEKDLFTEQECLDEEGNPVPDFLYIEFHNGEGCIAEQKISFIMERLSGREKDEVPLSSITGMKELLKEKRNYIESQIKALE